MASLKWVIALAIVAAAVTLGIHARVAGHFQWPWQIAQQVDSGTNPLVALWRIISDQNFWYVFGWLLPLGIWRLRDFPRPWIIASVATAVLALAFGVFNDSLGNVSRAILDIVGPLLSLSTAGFILRLFESSGKAEA